MENNKNFCKEREKFEVTIGCKNKIPIKSITKQKENQKFSIIT